MSEVIRLLLVGASFAVFGGAFAGAGTPGKGGEDAEWAAGALTELDRLDTQGLEGASGELVRIAQRAAESGQGEVLAKSLGLMRRLSSPDDVENAVRAAESSGALRVALESCYGHYYSFLPVRQRVCDLIVQSALDERVLPALNTHFVELLLEIVVDENLRRQCLEQVVLAQKPRAGARQAACALAPLLEKGSPSWTRCSALAQEALRRGEYHLSVEVLAYHGDQAILQALDDALAQQPPPGPTAATYLGIAKWRIDVQNPPERLLLQIREAGPEKDRAWMIERAVSLGLPREHVRAAILAYAATQRDADDLHWMRQRPPVIEAIEKYSIMDASEKASIPAAKRLPTQRGER